MKFEIRLTEPYCNEDLTEIEMLKERGVEFRLTHSGEMTIEEEKAQYIEIEDLDSLLTFCHEFGGRLVIETDTPTIEIYNGWRE